MKLSGKNKTRLLKIRMKAAIALLSLGFTTVGMAMFPVIQGGAWQSGNGYQLLVSGGTNSGSINGTLTVSDPHEIDLGEAGVWTGDKITLNGVTPLLGSMDTIQQIKVKIPGAMAVVLASTSGNVPALLTLINPAGTTATASCWVVRITGPNYQPNNVDGNEKIVTIKIAEANKVLNGI